MKPGAMRAIARHNHTSFQQNCKCCYVSASKLCFKAYAQSKRVDINIYGLPMSLKWSSLLAQTVYF